MRLLRICFVAAEMTPLAKTGGLADVITGLSRWLAQQGHDVRVILPCYRRIAEKNLPRSALPAITNVDLRLPQRTLRYSLEQLQRERGEPTVYLLDCRELYDRDALYTQDGDEALRFAFLCRAAIEGCQRLQWAPDVFHCHDWHSALLPLYLKTVYGWDRLFAPSRTLLTIHNIGYQGVFADSELAAIGLSDQRAQLHHGDLREGRFSCLKTGVLHAHRLSTVSRTYAREIQTAEYGMGIDELLRERSADLVGIVNGADYSEWDPANDELIPHAFSASDLRGKAHMKAALLSRLGLPPAPKAPVFGVVSRLTSQKGFDLFADSIPVVLQREDLRLCVLGSGDQQHERYFQWLRDTWPQKVGIYRGYHEELAHWIEAGSDVFLMPSRYEPCGLNQIYSMRYGTPPVVRRTGGLADTVTPWDPQAKTGSGFLFDEFSSHALLATMEWVLRNWQDQQGWRQLVLNAMAVDFSWQKQGPEYVALYRALAAPR